MCVVARIGQIRRRGLIWYRYAISSVLDRGCQSLLNGDCVLNGRHYSAIGTDVVEIKATFLAVLQPFVADLITAYSVCVRVRRTGPKYWALLIYMRCSSAS